MQAKQARLPGILDKEDFGLPDCELTPAAVRVLEARYLLRNEDGEIVETPRQLFTRVARAIAKVEGEHEQKYTELFSDLLMNLRFLPNSPTLMNAGKKNGQLSACFVLPIEDSIEQVFETLKNSVLIHKTGGGTGFNFGELRPAGDRISHSAGKSSGPLAFIKIFDAVTNTVKQGGTRRGANMAVLPVDHPDVEEFILSKKNGGIENFNISVAISNSFMEAVFKKQKWPLVNPRTHREVKKVSAEKLWKLISEAAWACGDPGVVFTDQINDVNPTPKYGPMVSTNPCGEVPLLAYESCNLGSMNLLPYVQGNDLNWDFLERDVELAVRFLDNIIETNAYPLKKIDEMTKSNRKIGLGVMGWADVLLEWGIPYDSEDALEKAKSVMSRIEKVAIRASEKLAVERGPFPAFSESMWAKRGEKPRRNATVTTIAPTGTISIIAGVSSGIEPIFSLAYERNALDGQNLVFVHPALRRVLKKENIKSKKAVLKVLETGTISQFKELAPKVRRIFKTASEISPISHVRMQAAFQKHTENAVSKTINLPASVNAKQIRKIYEEAFKQGCKGITVFRDSSKTFQVLNRGVAKKKKKLLAEAIDWLLDEPVEEKNLRKKTSVDLATLSREKMRQGR